MHDIPASITDAMCARKTFVDIRAHQSLSFHAYNATIFKAVKRINDGHFNVEKVGSKLFECPQTKLCDPSDCDIRRIFGYENGIILLNLFEDLQECRSDATQKFCAHRGHDLGETQCIRILFDVSIDGSVCASDERCCKDHVEVPHVDNVSKDGYPQELQLWIDERRVKDEDGVESACDRER